VINDNDNDLHRVDRSLGHDDDNHGLGRDNHEERHDHHEERRNDHYDHDSGSRRSGIQFGRPGGENLKTIGRILILIFIVILLSGPGPFHNDVVANASQVMYDGIMNIVNAFNNTQP
jgi:hypothetical protein